MTRFRRGFHSPSAAFFLLWLVVAVALASCAPEPEAPQPSADPSTRQVIDSYLESYLDMYPTRATAAGDHRADRRLEDLSPEKLGAWIEENRRVRDRLAAYSPDEGGDPAFERNSLSIDVEVTLRQVSRELFRLETRRAHQQNPLFWSSILGNTSVFLLVRTDLPLGDRLDRLADRVEQIPRLCEQAGYWTQQGDPERRVADFARMAAGQISAGSGFFKDGLDQALAALTGSADDPRSTRLKAASDRAAHAMAELAELFQTLAETSTGDPRLGDLYAESFRLGTGIERTVDEVLAQAEQDLRAAREETAAFCRSIWDQISDASTPADDRDVIRQCFQRIGRDGPRNQDDFVKLYRELTQQAHDFVVEHQILTPPGPLTLQVDRSPAFLAGQSVGGIYPAGPYSPEAEALLFVPSVPDDAPEDLREAFYGDFNQHFNVMITPHETIPGHYAQGKWAALEAPKIRAVFSNGVYVEGWGTFSERLMLDHGWGDDLARVAHYKKQLENIGRTIVDIRVHTRGMDRDEMLEFLREDAMQDGQFAVNMWTRAITSSPQLTTYYLGFRQISDLYSDWRAAHPDAPPKDFSDTLMSLGAVAVDHYRPLLEN